MHHEVVVLNEALHNWKLIDSNLCSFCQNKADTTEHLFLKCPHVITMWNCVNGFLRGAFKVSEVPLFNPPYGKYNDLEYLTFLCAKGAIYQTHMEMKTSQF